MKPEKYCIDSNNNICCDYHEGLCMAWNPPKPIADLIKCPDDCVTFGRRQKR